MVLSYGQFDNSETSATIEKLKHWKYLTHSWNYQANNNGLKKKPIGYKSGNPTPYAATYGLDEDSTLTFLTHKYDSDETIDAPFTMEYKVWCLHNTGKSYNVLVWTADLANKYRVGSTNIFALNHTIKFKDIIGWYKGMVGFQVEIKMISGTGYNNESILDVLVTI